VTEKPFVAAAGNNKLVFCYIVVDQYELMQNLIRIYMQSINSIIISTKHIKQLDYNLCTHAVLFGYALKTDQLGVNLNEKLLEG
jgi:hypothetical protein